MAGEVSWSALGDGGVDVAVIMGEIGFVEADDSTHGFDAAWREPIETAVLALCNEAMTAEFGKRWRLRPD
ncbi:MAG: hypothetical protein HQL95_02660 [Magnetococcales bacterium]|nr:hypothetical protein [Magnetococcales bacterium]